MADPNQQAVLKRLGMDPSVEVLFATPLQPDMDNPNEIAVKAGGPKKVPNPMSEQVWVLNNGQTLHVRPKSAISNDPASSVRGGNDYDVLGAPLGTPKKPSSARLQPGSPIMDPRKGHEGAMLGMTDPNGGDTLIRFPDEKRVTSTDQLTPVKDPSSGRTIGLRDDLTGDMIAVPKPEDRPGDGSIAGTQAATGAQNASTAARQQAANEKAEEIRLGIEQGRLTEVQAERQWKQWYATNVEIPMKAEEAQRARDKEARDAEDQRRKQAMDEARFGLDSNRQALDEGDRASKREEALLPYQVAGGHSRVMADALNEKQSSDRPEGFQPAHTYSEGDFQLELPDLQGIADDAAASARGQNTSYQDILAAIPKPTVSPAGFDPQAAVAGAPPYSPSSSGPVDLGLGAAPSGAPVGTRENPARPLAVAGAGGGGSQQLDDYR